MRPVGGVVARKKHPRQLEGANNAPCRGCRGCRGVVIVREKKFLFLESIIIFIVARARVAKVPRHPRQGAWWLVLCHD